MERPDPDSPLVHAAHVIAHGGELDHKLDALAAEALITAGASAAAIYVLDPTAGTVVPAAAAGAELSALSAAGVIALADTDSLAARATRERRPATGRDTSAAGTALGSHAAAVALPLVFADDANTEESEGALLVAYATTPPEDPATDVALIALADMCAIAIRQARLENTLLERAEWMSRVASSDALTGLPNRNTFERMLELELARSTRQRTELSVVLFDVDGLTAINEQHGADVGDDVLRTTASLIAEQIRLVDGAARIGPDEFGLVAPTGGGAVVGRRIRDAAARVPLPAGGQLSLSVAVVVFPHDGATSAELMARAAEVLAEAQREGPGTLIATRELTA